MYTFERMNNWKYRVYYQPNKILKLLGFKDKEFMAVDTGRVNWIDKSICWFNRNTGKYIGKFKELDNFIKQQNA